MKIGTDHNGSLNESQLVSVFLNHFGLQGHCFLVQVLLELDFVTEDLFAVASSQLVFQLRESLGHHPLHKFLLSLLVPDGVRLSSLVVSFGVRFALSNVSHGG